ncbi:MAG: hypothetical protein ACOYL6_09030 [Bacteriovoracaceae bacterium]
MKLILAGLIVLSSLNAFAGMIVVKGRLEIVSSKAGKQKVILSRKYSLQNDFNQCSMRIGRNEYKCLSYEEAKQTGKYTKELSLPQGSYSDLLAIGGVLPEQFGMGGFLAGYASLVDEATISQIVSDYTKFETHPGTIPLSVFNGQQTSNYWCLEGHWSDAFTPCNMYAYKNPLPFWYIPYQTMNNRTVVSLVTKTGEQLVLNVVKTKVVQRP